MVETEQLRSVCPLDCPDACSLTVYKENGTIVKVAGNDHHPVTRGAICNKVRHIPQRTYHPERLMYPLRRVGPKGTHRFERISWADAYQEIAQRYEKIRAEFGAESILPYSFYGNMGVLNAEGMDRRFFNRLGASQLQRSICNAAGAEGYRHTMGTNAGMDPEESIHSKLIIVWGCNLVSTNMHQVMYANEARKHGARIVHIDVHRNRTSRWADWFIPVLPGSDAALALGIMHVLIEERMVNLDFVSKYTIGYDALCAQVRNYPPEKVSRLTGVPVDDIVRLARMYGETTPSFIRIGNGLQHHDNGGMIVRTIACLPALTGQWGKTGGGAVKGNSSYAALNTDRLQRPDLRPNPNVRTINMNQLGDALWDANPPIKALFVYNSNPAQVAPDQTRVRSGFMRDDLFTVVHDLFLTDTCLYADLVLPATSHFENTDLYKSYWHLYLQLHEPVIPVLGECKSNFTLFRELAHVMGFTDSCFAVTEMDMIREALDNPHNPFFTGQEFDALKEHGWVKLDTSSHPFFPANVPTPSRKIELFSEMLASIGLSPVPTHTAPVESDLYPLRFVPGPNHNFLNTTFANVPSLQAFEGRPTLTIHPEDADVRGIADGDWIRVWNQRGECHLMARVAPSVLPGVVVSEGLWWQDDKRGYQSVNTLTPQRLADMGGGATFFSARVDVQKVNQSEG